MAFQIRLGQLPLKQLQLSHRRWSESYPNHTVMILNRHSSAIIDIIYRSWGENKFDEYMSGLKRFKQHNPTLPVLICGTRGNRWAAFIYEYIEDDFNELPLHAVKNERPHRALKNEEDEVLNFDKYRYQGYYYIPYRDNV